MAIPVKPVPDGYHVVNPLLVVNDAARAIEFYTMVFGATERSRLAGPAGRLPTPNCHRRLGDHAGG